MPSLLGCPDNSRDPNLQDAVPALLREINASIGQDREAGLVRIPIEEAMRLVSEGHRASVEVPQDDCTGAPCPGATPTARTIP